MPYETCKSCRTPVHVDDNGSVEDHACQRTITLIFEIGPISEADKTRLEKDLYDVCDESINKSGFETTYHRFKSRMARMKNLASQAETGAANDTEPGLLK